MSDDARIICGQLDQFMAEVSEGAYMKEATEFVQSAAKLNAPADSGHLRNHIFSEVERTDLEFIGSVFTNVEYAVFVELGTGPRGALNHAGISPNVRPAYTLKPWWIHESQLDVGIAEKYGWGFIDTPQGRFYKCSGQPALPYLYPALKDNEQEVEEIIRKGINRSMEKVKR